MGHVRSYKKFGPDISVHTRLTRVSSIRFLLLEIKRVLVFNSIIFYFTDLFILYIFIQNAYANKKVFRTKAYKLCLIGQIVIESHSFLEYWQNLNVGSAVLTWRLSVTTCYDRRKLFLISYWLNFISTPPSPPITELRFNMRIHLIGWFHFRSRPSNHGA